MRWIAKCCALTLAATLTSGCSKSEPAPAENQAAAPPAAPAVPPEVVVREFLHSVQIGDHQKAESLLTDLAQQKTKEMDLMVAPPGSATAKFEVGEVEFEENGQIAKVESYWTDIGEDGKPMTNMFVWFMRLDAPGWRIGGVATKLFDDADPLLLDFEDPEDMMRKTQLAEQEMQRRAGGAPAATPSGTSATITAGATMPAPTNSPASGLQTPPGLLPPGAANPVDTGQLPPGAFTAPGTTSPLQAQQPNPTQR